MTQDSAHQSDNLFTYGLERRKFTREFKLEAVRLIRERGVSYTQASQDLGVHQSQLRHWAKKFADDPQHAFPGHGQMKPEQLEIAQLKREVIVGQTVLLGECGAKRAERFVVADLDVLESGDAFALIKDTPFAEQFSRDEDV